MVWRLHNFSVLFYSLNAFLSLIPFPQKRAKLWKELRDYLVMHGLKLLKFSLGKRGAFSPEAGIHLLLAFFWNSIWAVADNKSGLETARSFFHSVGNSLPLRDGCCLCRNTLLQESLCRHSKWDLWVSTTQNSSCCPERNALGQTGRFLFVLLLRTDSQGFWPLVF